MSAILGLAAMVSLSATVSAPMSVLDLERAGWLVPQTGPDAHDDQTLWLRAFTRRGH